MELPGKVLLSTPKMLSLVHNGKEERKAYGKDAFAYLLFIFYFCSFNDKSKIILIDNCEI